MYFVSYSSRYMFRSSRKMNRAFLSRHLVYRQPSTRSCTRSCRAVRLRDINRWLISIAI